MPVYLGGLTVLIAEVESNVVLAQLLRVTFSKLLHDRSSAVQAVANLDNPNFGHLEWILGKVHPCRNET